MGVIKLPMRDKISQKDILLAFENVLKIEYKERDIEKIRITSKTAIENAYQVKLNSDIYTAQASNRFVGDTLDLLLSQLTECLKSQALLTGITMFDGRFGITLRDVNYLGFAERELLAALQYLQSEVLYEKRNSFLPAMIRNSSNIELSPLKRMLTIMFVLETLGVKEGVALMAQYLYLGARS